MCFDMTSVKNALEHSCGKITDRVQNSQDVQSQAKSFVEVFVWNVQASLMLVLHHTHGPSRSINMTHVYGNRYILMVTSRPSYKFLEKFYFYFLFI